MRYVRQLAIFLLLLVACGVIIWLVYTDIETKTIDQVNSEQMVHAEQAAQGIGRFFTTYNNTLAFLAGDRHIIAMDTDGRLLMQNFYTAHAGEISSITRVDEKGIILYTYPFEASTGTDISGQGHVRQELQSQRVVTSDVFTSVQGFRTVAMHMPVFDGSSYKGSIAILIPFDTLAGRNVAPIHILMNGHGWVVSRESGTILYSPRPDQIGKPATAVYAGSPSVVEFVSLAMKGDSGSSPYTIGPEKPGESPATYEAVYRQVPIGSAGWSIIVATPREEILETLREFRLNLTIIVLILGISLFFFTYYIVQARGIVREEAQRQAADEALRESERNYRDIIENLQDAFVRTDPEGRITMASPSTLRLIGVPSEAVLLGKPILPYYTDPAERESMIATLRRNGTATDHEVHLRRIDGTVLTALVNSHVLTDRDGKFLGIEGIIRDITDRKRAETALQLATRKLNLLSTITTTNIRNATFSLAAYLELEQTDGAEARRKEFHGREMALVAQINHWLGIAKTYESLGLNPPRWQQVSTTFILAISHLDFSRKKHRVDVEGLEIYADPLLETVFLNIAENFLIHAGTATLLTLRCEESADGLILIIEDDGKGIPDAMKQALFAREFAPTKGVGLFMAREILEITGMSIRETGTFGRGARFEIRVPPGGYRFVIARNNGSAPAP